MRLRTIACAVSVPAVPEIREFDDRPPVGLEYGKIESLDPRGVLERHREVSFPSFCLTLFTGLLECPDRDMCVVDWLNS